MTLAALKIIIEDHLRFSPIVRYIMSYWCYFQARRMRAEKPQQIAHAIVALCKAARTAADSTQLIKAETAIDELVKKLGNQPINWSEFEAEFNSFRIEKGVLLKPCLGPKERGVIYISFEYQWIRLLNLPDLADFARDYTLVLAPAWCPPHSLLNCLFPTYYPEPVFCQISNQKDLDYFPQMSKNYRMIPLLASHWVDPDWFHPSLPEEKDIDIVMVANWGKFKRHHALFKALRDMPTKLRVVLVGQDQDNRTAADLQREAEVFGVSGRFELLVSQPHDKVCELLARAKISLILSRREGSCVVVAESLFANTPVGMLVDAEVGSKQFINDQTGRLFQHSNLAAQLMDFLSDAARYQPRKWALEQGRISCRDSSATLNSILKQSALESGQQWTEDIAQMQWRPDPQLLNEADRLRLRGERERIVGRFGIEVGN